MEPGLLEMSFEVLYIAVQDVAFEHHRVFGMVGRHQNDSPDRAVLTEPALGNSQCP